MIRRGISLERARARFVTRTPRPATVKSPTTKSQFATKVGNYSAETIEDIVQINAFLANYKDNAKVMSLDKCPKELQQKFLNARRDYKIKEENGVKEFFGRMERWKKRSADAVASLPPRLKLQALCAMEQTWEAEKAVDFPQAYNPRNLLTAPAHVRSTLETNWKPGDDIATMSDIVTSASTKIRTEDFLLDEDISEMGHRGRPESAASVSKSTELGKKKETKEQTSLEKHAQEMKQRNTKIMLEQWKRKLSSKKDAKSTYVESAKAKADEITADNLPTMDDLLKDKGKSERFFELLPDLLQQMDPKKRADFVGGFRLLYHKKQN